MIFLGYAGLALFIFAGAVMFASRLLEPRSVAERLELRRLVARNGSPGDGGESEKG